MEKKLMVKVEEEVKTEIEKDVCKIRDLGFHAVAKEVEDIKEFDRKTMLAYEHFRFVSPEKFEEFNNKLRKKTENYNSSSRYITYDKLVLTKIDKYPKLPPKDVLEKLEQAQNMNCFDDYEVAHIVSQQERVDPILFGSIKNCKDRFFIAQWDNDVKIEDILKDNEG